jgi:hypothetical protein
MDLDIQKTSVTYFTHKSKDIYFKSHVGDVLILRTDYAKYLSIIFDRKLYFHHNVNYTSSQALRLAGFTCFICFFIDILKVLDIALIRSKS